MGRLAPGAMSHVRHPKAATNGTRRRRGRASRRWAGMWTADCWLQASECRCGVRAGSGAPLTVAAACHGGSVRAAVRACADLAHHRKQRREVGHGPTGGLVGAENARHVAGYGAAAFSARFVCRAAPALPAPPGAWARGRVVQKSAPLCCQLAGRWAPRAPRQPQWAMPKRPAALLAAAAPQ